MEIDEGTCSLKMDVNEYETIGEISFKSSPDPFLSTKSDFHRGILNNPQIKIVVKKLDIGNIENRKAIKREISSGSLVEEDENVLKLKRYKITESMCLLAYQNYDYSLENLVLGIVPPLDINLSITKVLYYATKGLMEIHDRNIVHRNIRPENIVIHKEKGMIAKFSLSKIMLDGKKVSITQDFSDNDYSAPELLQIYKKNLANQKKASGTIPNKAVGGREGDIFSMGIVYYYALTGSHLFERDGTKITENILKKNFELSFKALINSSSLEPWRIPLAIQLITAMVQYDPKNRPTVRQILNHPFFWSNTKIEKFPKIASHYIQGCDEYEKSKVSSNSVPGTENWEEDLLNFVKVHLGKHGWKNRNKENSKKKTLTEDVHIDPAKNLLRNLRNLPEHVNEKKNECLRKRIEYTAGGMLEYFLRKHPNSLSNFYDCFIEFSSYDTLRNFYCDCYLDDHFSVHKCSTDDNFCPYDWLNFAQIINN